MSRPAAADLAAAAVTAGAAALADAVGVPLAAGPVVPATPPPAGAALAAVRTSLAGSGFAVALPAAVPALDEAGVAAADAAAAFATGALTAVAAAVGTSPASGVALPTATVAAGPGTETFSAELTGAGTPIPVIVVVEPGLAAPAEAPQVAPAAFPELGPGSPTNGHRDLSVLSDVPMSVTVELGRARMRVRELLSLNTGSVIELDRAAGAAVDVLVNGTVVARGDVVVIDDELGVRITEVLERS